MAGTDFELFDAEFATKQFSGNHALLNQILGKFIAQHQDFDTLLTQHIQQGDLDTAAHHVHTLKGVSGNLGMSALYNACKIFEGHLSSQVSPENLDDLLQVFSQTLAEVKAFSAQDKVQTPPSETMPSSDKAELIAALERNEFISDSKMQSYLQALSVDSEMKTQIQQAINDLDYSKAIQLLE